ncbi:MAG: hypothetical protein LBJ67_05150 [Planctomycetaceae bacterium]|nr:hypothetical protein [Planctomycetaceae bacterium]
MKTRTVGNITSLGIETISLIARLLKGNTLLPADDAFKIIRSRSHGHVDAILRAIRQLGLDQIISREFCRQRDLVLAMIVQRIIAPRSKLGTTREWNNTTLAEELNIDTKKEDADLLYAAMDWLLKRQSRIEQKLAQRYLSEDSMAWYDISSSYVEGECCPLSIQAYSGNTHDSTTVIDQVEQIRHQ